VIPSFSGLLTTVWKEMKKKKRKKKQQKEQKETELVNDVIYTKRRTRLWKREEKS